MAKLNALRQLLAEENLDITVDGHIQTSSIPELISNGATTLVLGTSSLLDSSSSREDNMRRIKYSITEGI
jgi:pentose-5-phosphate-3-epimerase